MSGGTLHAGPRCCRVLRCSLQAPGMLPDSAPSATRPWAANNSSIMPRAAHSSAALYARSRPSPQSGPQAQPGGAFQPSLYPQAGARVRAGANAQAPGGADAGAGVGLVQVGVRQAGQSQEAPACMQHCRRWSSAPVAAGKTAAGTADGNTGRMRCCPHLAMVGGWVLPAGLNHQLPALYAHVLGPCCVPLPARSGGARQHARPVARHALQAWGAAWGGTGAPEGGHEANRLTARCCPTVGSGSLCHPPAGPPSSCLDRVVEGGQTRQPIAAATLGLGARVAAGAAPWTGALVVESCSRGAGSGRVVTAV